MSGPPVFPRPSVCNLLPFVALLGVYLSVQGYQSLDGDQAYRLPLLLHLQNPALYASDPFVRAFDAFNPHRGYLALLDVASQPLGLTVALFVLFTLTFAGMALGISGLARATWGGASGVGAIAVGLVLLDRAGNVGTNQLFDGMLLDRLIALALGWMALAVALAGCRAGWWLGSLAIGVAACLHPSMGWQLAALLATGWIVWAGLGATSGVSSRDTCRALAALFLAMMPALWLHGGSAGALFRGLPLEDFFLLSASVQSPQHMLPHLWRTPQWLAWGSTMLLAGVSLWLVGGDGQAARRKLGVLLAINLMALGVAWIAVEVWHDARITLFQPFRMATVARGLALVALAGHIRSLLSRGDVEGKVRSCWIAAGLTGDWTLVVVTLVEVACLAAERFAPRVTRAVGLGEMAVGIAFLSRHDTESGQFAILGATLVAVVGHRLTTRVGFSWTPRRLAWTTAVAWALPIAAAVVPQIPALSESSLAQHLSQRCRFGERPKDDLERLALWCREQTPANARFIGPPGPKTFRLWSRRDIAFNRAGSPYHAEGLADWAARFREHVGFHGTNEAFARAYLADRQGLERRYLSFDAAELAELARRQGATYVLAGPGKAAPGGPLELRKSEGRYAVYRLRDQIAHDDPTEPCSIAAVGRE